MKKKSPKSTLWYDLAPSERAAIEAVVISLVLMTVIAWLDGGMSILWFLGITIVLAALMFNEFLKHETADAVYSERRRHEIRLENNKHGAEADPS